jgi:hypothetical protein
MKYLAISATLALLAAFLGALVASANPYEGHPCDWAKDTPGVQLLLQQNWIAGDQVDICSNQFPASTQEGGRRWNDPTALNFSVFRYRSCDGYQDALAQTYSDFDATCGAGMHACVYPTAPDWAGYDMVPVGAGIAYIYMNPNISWPDNDAHTTRDITHELGHVLGLADISCSTYGNTLMSDSEGTCNFAYPQPIDINDYHILYHADPVQNVVASSPSANTVNLSWSQIIAGTSYDIPNEKSFTIKRGDCGGSPTFVTTVAKNTTSKTLTGEPAGTWTYCVFSDSDADNHPATDRSWWPSNQVTVTGPTPTPLPAPSTVSSNFTYLSAYGVFANGIGWSSVAGANHYHVCTDTSTTGSYSTCYDATGTLYYWALPSGDGTKHYYRIRSCSSTNSCGALTTDYALSEQVNHDGWNYMFTHYRNGSSTVFQYLNWMTYGSVPLGLKLHIKNGSSTSSTTKTTTSCLASGYASNPASYPTSSYFTSHKLGTVGHTIGANNTCGASSDHSGDATFNRWGYVPPYNN